MSVRKRTWTKAKNEALMSLRKRIWKTAKGKAREAWVVDYVDPIRKAG
jgi:hypothetical protein